MNWEISIPINFSKNNQEDIKDIEDKEDKKYNQQLELREIILNHITGKHYL